MSASTITILQTRTWAGACLTGLIQRVVVACLMLAVAAFAWQKKPSLSLQQVEALLGVKLPDATVAAEIKERGLAFRLTRAAIGRLKDRGAGTDTLEALMLAIQDLDRAIELNPRLASAYANRGACYWNLKNVAQAIQDSGQSISLDPSQSSVFSLRGRAYSGLGDWVNAERDLREAARLGSEDYRTYHELGMVLFVQQKGAESIPFFDRALALRPDYSESLRYRGFAKMGIGRTEEALADFRRVEALNWNRTEDRPARAKAETEEKMR